MGGPEIFSHLQQINNKVKVVIFSGDPEQLSVRQMMDQGARGVLAKPFSLDQLSQAIQQAAG